MSYDSIYRYIFRTLVPAGLLAAAYGTAAAQSQQEATLAISSPVKLVGEVSVEELAKQPAIVQARRPPVEMPRHRLPDGSSTVKFSKSTLDTLRGTLPTLPPNVNVEVAPSFGSVKGFVGIHSKDQATVNGFELEPPDQGLAVNKNVAAEIINVIVRFFNATTGAPLTPAISAWSFFMADTRNVLSDPQALFDPTTGRWFFTSVETNFGSVENLDVAVSKTSNPLGTYFIYHLRAASRDLFACGGSDCLPDYPHAGYDANGLYISVDLFNVSRPPFPFVAAAAYALPKSKLVVGASFTPVRLTYPLGNSFVVQPSVPAPGEPFETAANGTEYLMEARNVIDGSRNIRVWAISNTKNIVSNPSSLRAFFVDIPGETYGRVVPATEPNLIGPFCRSTGTFGTPLLDGLFNGFQATVQKANGKLYGALPFGSVDGNGLPRDSIAWFALKPSVSSTGHPSASIVNQGYVVPPNGYSLLNPAFGLNKSGAGALGFTITNKSKNVPGGFPSAGFIQFTGTGPAGGIKISGQGIASDDGLTGCTGGPAGVGRWGDYGAATIDAATGFFYTANENISGARGMATNWGTFITQLH
jgi:hypothetical protein